jgi:transcriptional antiterminator RfaH
LKEGQSVRVTAGPFADFIGELEHLDDKGRVSVLLEIMGGKMRVALPHALVAPS